MRIYNVSSFTMVVYLIRFSAAGLVRRHHDYPDNPTKIRILGRDVRDAVFMEVCGGDDEFAAVEVQGTAITWGWGDRQGMHDAAQIVKESSVWVHAGKIDGIIRDAVISIERVVGCDPKTGSTKVWSVQLPERDVQRRREANPCDVGHHQ